LVSRDAARASSSASARAFSAVPQRAWAAASSPDSSEIRHSKKTIFSSAARKSSAALG